MAIIVLDPGHGGTAPLGNSSPNNATGPRGTREKDVCLRIAIHARRAAEAKGHVVILTRESDINLSLADRVRIAREAGANLFVSIHFNGDANPKTQGTETFVGPDANPQSRRLAARLQRHLCAATGLRDRGVKEARFTVIDPARHTQGTAAALVEISFLTDPIEEARLGDETYRAALGEALAAALSAHALAEDEAPGTPPATPTDLPTPIETKMRRTPPRPAPSARSIDTQAHEGSRFGVTEALERLWTSPSVQHTTGYIGAPGAEILPGEAYLRIVLRAARLPDRRRGFSNFYPAIHAQSRILDPMEGERETISVIAPSRVFQEIDAESLDRVMTIDQPILGPVPYRGEIALQLGLFSVKAKDLAKPYLDLLKALSEAASIGFLNQALPFLAPLRRGAELLFADKDVELEIGLTRNFTRLMTGDILLAQAPRGSLDLTRLRLDPDDRALLDETGRAQTGFAYLVLGIEASVRRDDLYRIPDMTAAWSALRDLINKGASPAEIEAALSHLSRVIATSPDLLPADRAHILKRFEDTGATRTGANPKTPSPDLR